MTEHGSPEGTVWTRNPLAPTRHVRDARGRVWQVFEMVSAYDRRSSPVLVFTTEGLARRVRNYPPNWHDLPEEQLATIADEI